MPLFNSETPLKKEHINFTECVYQCNHPEKIDEGKSYLKWLLKYRIPVSNLLTQSMELKFAQGEHYNIKDLVESSAMSIIN